MKRVLQYPLWLLVAALPLAAWAQAYRWVDEKGQVHYSQVPPPGKRTEFVAPPPPPKAAPNQDALNQALDQARKDAPRQKQAAERAEQAQAQEQQQCDQFRAQVKYMDEKTSRRLATTDDKGNVSRTTKEDFQARRAELQRMISEHCS